MPPPYPPYPRGYGDFGIFVEDMVIGGYGDLESECNPAGNGSCYFSTGLQSPNFTSLVQSRTARRYGYIAGFYGVYSIYNANLEIED